MAFNSNAVTSETIAPVAKPEVAHANPITVEQAAVFSNALRPNAGLSNPVAEVQAKLRAAIAMEANPKPSKLQTTAFVTLMLTACVFTAAFGIILGIVCVLFGAAMFLFPVSAGTALGSFVLAVGVLFFLIYTHGVTQKSGKPGDTLEPLAAGRFSAAWGA